MDLMKTNGIKLESTSLSLTRRMDLEEAGQFVLGLDSMESGLAYWVGDLLNALEAIHGEAYTQVIPENKAHTWMNYKWVSERVKPTTRRPSLSWSHHQQVASLLTERQVIFLDRAEKEGLSVSSLRKLIKTEKGKVEESKLVDMECPSCGYKWQEVQDGTKRAGKPNSEVRAGKDDKVSDAG
jgi:predicted Zn-ribbon and HTH transcriptional regulator